MPDRLFHTHRWMLLLFTILSLSGKAAAVTPSTERQLELRNLLYQDCGSCHGMRLTGGLGPALTPGALRDKPRELLVTTVRDGRSGTPMPPWKQHLSDTDIEWLVDLLLELESQP